MADAATGTLTSLDSLFPAEAAQKAVRRVEEAISDRRDELRRLQGFVSDNSDVINLVRTLPDELSHQIMVPFGGAAFFPGRLIHTNEFLVLLGDNYYAERTSKQTAEILQRREKTLKAQLESLKLTINDLEVEANFFRSTATEAAEGLVEIREDYVEELHNNMSGSEADNSVKHDRDEEYARIMARLDELEKEELDDRSSSGSDDNEDDKVSSDGQNTEPFFPPDHKNWNLESDSLQKVRDKKISGSVIGKQVGSGSEQHLTLTSSIMDAKSTSIGAYPLKVEGEISDTKQKPPTLLSDGNPAISRHEESSDSATTQALDRGSTARRAFTGSIIEHDHDLPPVSSSESNTTGQSSGSTLSKPVSRFKKQRGSLQ